MNSIEYRRDPGRPRDETESSVLEHLADSRGIIYLFDPITERNSHDAIEYVDWTIAKLKRIIYRKHGEHDPRLPHRVAVCVTKFDHEKIYQRARELRFVLDGPNGIPMVPDAHAERFFDSLCSSEFWDKRYEGNREKARLVRERLSAAFHHERIKYYVTSSIGFSEKDPRAPFDGDRFLPNYEEDNTIVGDVRPINVLEPLIRLQQRIPRQRRR
jgi:hypothetical protein